MCCFDHSAIGAKAGLSQVTEWSIAWHSWQDRERVCVFYEDVCVAFVHVVCSLSCVLKGSMPWSESNSISHCLCLNGPVMHYVSPHAHTHTSGTVPIIRDLPLSFLICSVFLLIFQPIQTRCCVHLCVCVCVCSQVIILCFLHCVLTQWEKEFRRP